MPLRLALKSLGGYTFSSARLSRSMNQNQHIVQHAWQRQFSHNKHVRIVDVRSLNHEDRKPKVVATREDFQSRENEHRDHLIETHAFNVLRGIKKGRTDITDEHRGHLDCWVSLHLSRSTRDLTHLTESGFDYDDFKRRMYDDSLTLVSQFNLITTLYLNDKQEPLILSDNPIVRLASKAVIVPFSPNTAIVFSNEDPRGWTFEGRTVNEAFNELSFLNSQEFFMCHPAKHPDIEDLAERSPRRCLIEVQIDKMQPESGNTG